MAKAERSVVIEAPPEKVFAVIADYQKYPEFLPEVKKVKVESGVGDVKEVTYTVDVKAKLITPEYGSELASKGEIQIEGNKRVIGSQAAVARVLQGIKIRYPKLAENASFSGASSEKISVELSDAGLEQVARLPEALARFPISRVVSSPQRRAVQTAEPVAAVRQLTVDIDARLIERWRPNDDRPEILTEGLTWTPEGATTPFALDLTHYFTRIWDG